MAHPQKKTVTPEEYLAMEEKAEYKSEYCEGEIFALAGGSINHNQIAINVTTALTRLFAAKPCRVFMSDVRLHVEKSRLYAYPDVMVVCGKIEFVTGRDDTVKNPIVLFEVWSDSTKAYDRGEKFAMYRQIPTLQEYVMIDQPRPYVEHFRRDGHFWVLETLEKADAVLTLPSLDAEIAFETIYDKVEWQGAAGAAS